MFSCGDNSFMVDIYALAYFCGLDTCMGANQVVSDHQCLPTLHEVSLLLEGLGCMQIKDTNNSFSPKYQISW